LQDTVIAYLPKTESARDSSPLDRRRVPNRHCSSGGGNISYPACQCREPWIETEDVPEFEALLVIEILLCDVAKVKIITLRFAGNRPVVACQFALACYSSHSQVGALARYSRSQNIHRGETANNSQPFDHLSTPRRRTSLKAQVLSTVALGGEELCGQRNRSRPWQCCRRRPSTHYGLHFSATTSEIHAP
jgi:hypothetical protein